MIPNRKANPADENFASLYKNPAAVSRLPAHARFAFAHDRFPALSSASACVRFPVLSSASACASPPVPSYACFPTCSPDWAMDLTALNAVTLAS